MKRALPGKGWKLNQCRHVIYRQQVRVSESSFLDYWTPPHWVLLASLGAKGSWVSPLVNLCCDFMPTYAFVC